MPKPKSHTRKELVSSAMMHFWRHGYVASMDDLVRATGVSRHGIYAETGGKHGLFAACLEAYVEEIVTPAFARVEQTGATLAEVAGYFEHQIALAEKSGLPGPGCLMANTMTEIAPHDASARASVENHNERLREGFRNALRNSQVAGSNNLTGKDREALAWTLVVFANGLWSMSRTVGDAAVLRRTIRTMLQLVERRITP